MEIPTQQIQLTCAFNYLFGVNSELDKQQFQDFANTCSLYTALVGNNENSKLLS
jgi:hypothetical protein